MVRVLRQVNKAPYLFMLLFGRRRQLTDRNNRRQFGERVECEYPILPTEDQPSIASQVWHFTTRSYNIFAGDYPEVNFDVTQNEVGTTV